ncbi:MAG: molybdenum cofactor guanylyltransferase [Firmicutes bacterium]|nr:molybdenum cofactor guanylyltransferase [Bacillota bacterium]
MKNFGTAVILAGGKSSRMGFDKQFLEVNKTKLVDIITRKLENQFEEIIVVTNKPEYYKDFPHKIVEDEIKEKGPLSGIHTALKKASSKYVYFLACDMPNINLKFIQYMKDKLNEVGGDGCLSRKGNWIEPFNSFYSKDIVPKIEEHLFNDKRSIHSLVRKLNFYYVEEEIALRYSPNWDMFMNLNTTHDLELYLSGKRVN